MEALLRWSSPTRGSVSPGEFIPVAESSGVIMQLGEFVLESACRQAAEWRGQGLLPEAFRMWVNVSAKQLSAGGISTLVMRDARVDRPAGRVSRARGHGDGDRRRGRRRSSGPRPSCATSTAAACRSRSTTSEPGSRRSASCGAFPVDVLKVDRSFVQGIEHDQKDAAITANLASLAHALGLTAVAEGIESRGQLRSARALGCDVAQGFLFARPAPPDVIVEHLRTRASAFPADEPEPGEHAAVATS